MTPAHERPQGKRPGPSVAGGPTVPSGIYKRHTPEATLPHRVGHEHLETFFALTRADYADPRPSPNTDTPLRALGVFI